MNDEIRVSIAIPFPSKRGAQIAYDVLRVDSEPKRSLIKKIFSLNENILEVVFTGTIAKNVRVGVTSFFESLILCTETQSEIGPPVSDKYSFY